MYHPSPSTVSLTPVFPGHYPPTPAKARPSQLQGPNDNAQTLGGHTPGSCMHGRGDIEETYACDRESDGDGELPDGAQALSPRRPCFSSASSMSSVEPRSIHDRVNADTDSTCSEASTINRLGPLETDASSVRFRMSDLPSIRSQVSTTFGASNEMVPPDDRAQCPSSLSLDLELVGLPMLNRSGNLERGVFLDSESLRYFGVDISCLSQPDGSNAWTLALGAGSPFPSISTSEETPQSGVSSTFSSPNISTSEHAEVSSTGSSPSLSLDYYGLESTEPTPANRNRTPLTEIDELDETSPSYEPRELTLDSPPLAQISAIAAEGSRSPFKEVINDVKKLGFKLKKIWKTRPPLVFPRGTRSKPLSTPPYATRAVDFYETVGTNTYGLRTPPGLSVPYVSEDVETTFNQDATPKKTESCKKLTKSQTTVEIKHIRRRTLPAGSLDDPSASPIITISARRPRPRSLIFTTSPDSNLADNISSSPRSNFASLQFPELTPSTPSRNRKRWSTLSFFTRS